MSKDREVLDFMRETLEKLERYAAMGEHQYSSDELLQDAIARQMEVLADSAGRLSAELQERHPEIPWAAINGFRNVLAHGYMGVAKDRVWLYLKQDVAVLEEMVRAELS